MNAAALILALSIIVVTAGILWFRRRRREPRFLPDGSLARTLNEVKS